MAWAVTGKEELHVWKMKSLTMLLCSVSTEIKYVV